MGMTCNSMTLAPEEQVRRAMRSRNGTTWADFGVALYPSGAMLNHSCSPTCLWFVRGGVLMVETVKPVKRGEELTIPYLPICGSTADRRNRIKKVFGFHCLCCRCSASDARGRATAARKRQREPRQPPVSGACELTRGMRKKPARRSAASVRVLPEKKKKKKKKRFFWLNPLL